MLAKCLGRYQGPGEDRNEESRMLTRGATRFSILEADPSAVVSFK